jgi:hypothetical protein
MPRLACWTCGRQIYTVAPLEALFAEERRCPRCGAFLRPERREGERRQSNRRVNPPNDPGPPKPARRPTAKAAAPTGKGARTGKGSKGDEPGDAASSADGGERRVADRRAGQRRRDWNDRQRPGSGPGSAGWQD